jgi:hypothetical protein
MKYLYLSSLCIILGCVARAQFSIVPQFGTESSKTIVNYNSSPEFSPLGAKFSPQASVRLDYKFKQGHGPFVGLATTRSGVDYTFSNPESGATNYTANRSDMKLGFEAGYQYTTKPLYFNKSGSKNKSTSTAAQPSTPTKTSCRDYYLRSRCGSSSYKTATAAPANNTNKGSWISFQPSAGMAFVPTASDAEIATSTQSGMNTYEYNAGNWKTAFIAGAGFIFGKNDHQKLIISVNYLKGIGNLQQQTLTTTTDAKPVTTTIASEVSNWNLRIGIPISLGKKPAPKKEAVIIQQKQAEVKQPALKPATEKKPKEQKKCGGYYMYNRCRKSA